MIASADGTNGMTFLDRLSVFDFYGMELTVHTSNITTVGKNDRGSRSLIVTYAGHPVIDSQDRCPPGGTDIHAVMPAAFGVMRVLFRVNPPAARRTDSPFFYRWLKPITYIIL